MPESDRGQNPEGVTPDAPLVVVQNGSAPAEYEELIDQAKDFAHASKAKATRRAYATDLADFSAFCKTHQANPLPATPQTVALYLTHHTATKSTATILRRMVAISQNHKLTGLPNPVADPHVREIVQGIKRTKGTAPHKKDPLCGDRLHQVIREIDPSTLKGKRDRALFLLTWFTACRRSEIAALDVKDLDIGRTGLKITSLKVTIRRSKTDQTGEGHEIGVPAIRDVEICPVRAVAAWIEASKISTIRGPLFRSVDRHGNVGGALSPADVGILVKRVTGKAGIDGDFAAHSLRAGYITTAASTKGVSEHDIQRVSGHKSVTILRGYVRKAKVFEDSPTTAMFGSSTG